MMKHKTGRFPVADEKLTVAEKLSLHQADRSRFADQQPEKLGCQLWKAGMTAREDG
jgi:hypothetical protein